MKTLQRVVTAGLVSATMLGAPSDSGAIQRGLRGFERGRAVSVKASLWEGAVYWVGLGVPFVVGTPAMVRRYAVTAELLEAHPECALACTAPICEGGGFCLEGRYVGAEVYLPTGASVWVVAHELGHALGFGHTRRGAMGPRLRPARSDRCLVRTAGYTG